MNNNALAPNLSLDPALDTCSCCDDLPTPPSRANRPGLLEIRYRLGTYGTFMEQLIAQLTRPALPGRPTLAALKTRRPDDGTLALLDAWSIVADVLTFYQERIANENYLRTATERRSVLELARAIGYELNPGVAASTYLAFTVETSPGSPDTVPIPASVQILSIPGPGELPQTFETTHAFAARSEWNKLRPRLTQPQNLAFQGNQLYLWTADADLAELLNEADLKAIADLTFLGQPPNADLGNITALAIEQIYLQGINQNLKVGQRLLFVGRQPDESTQTLVKTIQQVTQQPADNLTQIDFAIAPKPTTFFFAQLFYAFPFYTLVPTTLDFTGNRAQEQLNKPIRESSLQALLTTNQWSPKAFVAEAANPSLPPDPKDQGIFIFRQQLNCFGHNAPRHETLPVPDETRGGVANDPYRSSWDTPINPPSSPLDDIIASPDAPLPAPAGPRTVWENSQSKAYTEQDIYLERSLSEMTPESWILLENGSTQQPFQVESIAERSLVDYGLSGKSTGLTLTNKSGNSLEPADKSNSFLVRKTTVYAQSEQLQLAQLPIASPLEAVDLSSGTTDPTGVQSIELETLVIGWEKDQPILIQGNREDARNVTVAEVAMLEEIVHEGTNTTLYFQERLQYRYVRNSVTLYGNVVLATHGETIAEVIGSGDGAKTYQTFQIKKPPLTYTSANTPSGSASSLVVRVNNILWEESRAFYGLAPQAERYIVRLEDDGTTQVTFGDSRQGSRLPTGTENVTAVYRSGIGLEGEVPADSLTLLKKKPLGVKTVTNLLSATGAESPEQLGNARNNAPLTVLTLDRIVSRQDYEDFAAAFAGIGKAQAVDIWDGFTKQIHLTIAAANGDPVSSDSQTYENLKSAIQAQRDPGPLFTLATFSPRTFNVKATLKIDERYLPEQVQEQAIAVLSTAFSFAHRAFGEGVSAAEVIALIQPVAGVIAVDLDLLHRSDRAERLETYVSADIARWDAKQSPPIVATELLLINPFGIELEAIAL